MKDSQKRIDFLDKKIDALGKSYQVGLKNLAKLENQNCLNDYFVKRSFWIKVKEFFGFMPNL